MKYVGTRGGTPGISFSDAVTGGMPPQGGLYVPDAIPRIDLGKVPPGLDRLAATAHAVLQPFFDGDPSRPVLNGACTDAFDFPLKMPFLKRGTAVLELFHGPTAAFKDFGARFLGAWISARGLKPLVVVATSGDTGGAVAAAFHGKPGARVVVLFPKGRVSDRQRKQLVCWGDNVRALEVRGDFDDCQRLAKQAVTDAKLRAGRLLLSANSINLGRLLPQIVYYAAASLAYHQARGVAPGLIVPSGNLGNATAALYAREMGFPIREIVLATNANRTIADFLATGQYKPQPTVATLANAMDVSDPSNIERVRALYPDLAQLRKVVRAYWIPDDEIRDAIRDGRKRWDRVWCPHTATAVCVRERQVSDDWIIVATAHPAKFESIVEPLIGEKVPVPPALEALLKRPESSREIAVDYAELRRELERG